MLCFVAKIKQNEELDQLIDEWIRKVDGKLNYNELEKSKFCLNLLKIIVF